MISGNLNFLEPSGPLQPCNGTALPLTLLVIWTFSFVHSVSLALTSIEASVFWVMTLRIRLPTFRNSTDVSFSRGLRWNLRSLKMSHLCCLATSGNLSPWKMKPQLCLEKSGTKYSEQHISEEPTPHPHRYVNLKSRVTRVLHNLHVCTVHQWRLKHFIQLMHKYIIRRYN